MVKTIDDFKAFLSKTNEEIQTMKSIAIPEMYHLLIDYGRRLSSFPEEWKIKDNKILSCVSNVYITSSFSNNRVYYMGVSDSELVKGLVYILVEGMSGLTPKDITENAESCLEEFLKNTDLRASLTPNRANSFGSMFKNMKIRAATYLDKDI